MLPPVDIGSDLPTYILTSFVVYIYLQLPKVRVRVSKISKIVGLGDWHFWLNVQHVTCRRVHRITLTLSLIPNHSNPKTNPKYNHTDPTNPTIMTLTLLENLTKNFYTLDWLVLWLGLVVGAESSR